jgi:hypothetical protein
MDNASKNAGDMINKFSLLYNRCVLIYHANVEPAKLSLLPSSSISSPVLVQFRYIDELLRIPHIHHCL